MESLKVIVYLDDILITGRTKKEHLHNLQLVLQWLSTAVLRLKQEKCEFSVNAARPKSLTELKAFLGLLNYYGKFIRNLSLH